MSWIYNKPYTAQVGDRIWSGHFNEWLTVTRILSDRIWWFRLPSGQELQARTPLSHFNKQLQR